MTVEFSNDRHDGIVVCRVSDTVALADLFGAAQTMWGMIEPQDARVLLDPVDARFNLRPDEVAQLADFARRGSPGGGLRMVFLLANDLEFGQVRMFQSLRDADGTEIYVVRYRERARALALLHGTAGNVEAD